MTITNDSLYLEAHPGASMAVRIERCGGGLPQTSGGPACPSMGTWELLLYGRPSRHTYCAGCAAAKLRALDYVTVGRPRS